MSLGFSGNIMPKAMTLIIGIKLGQDAVIASDGLMRFHTARKDEEQVLKTIRLNDHLCLGFSGNTNYMVPILKAMGIPADMTDHSMLCQAWEDSGTSLRMGYYRAQKIIESQLHNVLLNAPGDTDVSEIPAVILIGKRYGEPIMCNWGYGTDWNAFEIGTGVGGAIYIGKIPPESTQERRQFEDLVEGDRSIGNAESRLIEAIRYAADWNGSKKINRNVATRRFSESFELHWHLDEPISNLPEPDLST